MKGRNIMKIKERVLSILTAGVLACSFVQPVAFAADEDKVEYTFDKKHELTDEVPLSLFETENEDEVQKKLDDVIEKACKNDVGDITYGDLAKVTRLDLHGMELTDLPQCLKYMVNLRTLDLSDNFLQSDKINDLNFTGLKKLNNLDLSYNYLTSVPSWYVLDHITKKEIDHNFINTDEQHYIKPQTPVYYFMKGEKVNANDLKNQILADITLDDNSPLPLFLYDPDEPAYDSDDPEPEEDYPLHIENFGLSNYLNEEGFVTISDKYLSTTVTVRLFNDKGNDNTKAVIKIFLLDGSSPSTVKARLETLLDEVENLDKTLYTANSWLRFENAQKTAQSIFDYPYSNAEMMKSALEQLSNAHNSLVAGIDADTKKILTDLSTVGNTYKKDDYTPSSYERLKASLDNITRIAADTNATLASAKSEILDFQRAQSGLEKSKLVVPNKIPKADFEEIFGENKTVSASGTTQSGRKYKWEYPGKNVTAPADFNPQITDNPTEEGAILIESGRAGGYVAFSTSQTGKLPGNGALILNVSDKFSDGTYYLYKWGGSGSLQGEVTVKGGNATAWLTEGGTYYISNVLQRFALSSEKLAIDSAKHAIVIEPCPGYSVTNFKKLFKYGGSVLVYDAEEKQVSSSTRIRTGMMVSSPNGEKYVITVMGDVNDDGYVNAADALDIMKYSISIPTKKPTSDDEKTDDEKTDDKDDKDNKSDKDNKNNKGNKNDKDDKDDNLGVNGNPEANEKQFGVGVTGINVADVNKDNFINALDALIILQASTR